MSENGLHRIPAMKNALEQIQETHSKSSIYYPGYGYGCSGCVGGTFPCATRKLADAGLAGEERG